MKRKHNPYWLISKSCHNKKRHRYCRLQYCICKCHLNKPKAMIRAAQGWKLSSKHHITKKNITAFKRLTKISGQFARYERAEKNLDVC